MHSSLDPISDREYQPVFYTVWQDAWLAISQPRQYIKWALQPFSRSIKYLLIILAVVSILSTVFFFINIRPHIVEFKGWIYANVPRIDYQDGILSVENDQPFGFTDSDEFFFKVDTTQSLDDEPRLDNFYKYGLLMTRDAAVLRDERGEQTVIYDELGLGDFSFDGEVINKWLDYVLKAAFAIVPLVVFFYSLAAKLLFSAFFAFLYYMLSGFKLDFVHLWSIGIYALTPAIVAGYLSFIFFPLLGLYTAVFLVYMILGTGYYRRFLEDGQIPKN